MGIKQWSPGGCKCCKPPCDTFICVTVKACGHSANATVQAVDSHGTVFGPITATGRVASLTRTAMGSGYTNGTYPLVFTGGSPTTPATGTFTVAGGKVTSLSLVDGGDGYTGIPTLSFPGAGGSGAAGTVTLTTKACISIPDKGNYTVTATGDCGSASQAITAALCSTNDLTLNVPGATLTIHPVTAKCDYQSGTIGNIKITGPLGYVFNSGSLNTISGFPPLHDIVLCVPTNGTYHMSVTTNSDCVEDIADQDITVSSCSGGATITVVNKSFTYDAIVTRCTVDPLEGATVMVTSSDDPGFSFTGTTGADGHLSPLPSLTVGCTYTMSVSHLPRYADSTPRVIGVSCANATGPPIVMLPATGYFYLCQCCDNPTVADLFLTDGAGTHALTWNPLSLVWRSPCITATGLTVSCDSFHDACNGTNPGMSDVAYVYELTCVSSTGKFMLSRSFPVCSDPYGNLSLVASSCDGDNPVTDNPEPCLGIIVPGLARGGDFALVDHSSCDPINFSFPLSFGIPETVVVSE